MDPIPSVQAILICEKIIEEVGSSRKSLINIFTGVRASAVPAPLSMALYMRLIDGEGTYVFRVDVVHLQSDRRIAQAILPDAKSTDRLQTMEVAIHIPQMIVPEVGKYEFQMYANDVFLGHTSIDVQLMEGGHPDASA